MTTDLYTQARGLDCFRLVLVCVNLHFKFPQYISENCAIIDNLDLFSTQLKQSKSVVLRAHFKSQSQRLNNLYIHSTCRESNLVLVDSLWH